MRKIQILIHLFPLTMLNLKWHQTTWQFLRAARESRNSLPRLSCLYLSLVKINVLTTPQICMSSHGKLHITHMKLVIELKQLLKHQEKKAKIKRLSSLKSSQIQKQKSGGGCQWLGEGGNRNCLKGTEFRFCKMKRKMLETVQQCLTLLKCIL